MKSFKIASLTALAVAISSVSVAEEAAGFALTGSDITVSGALTTEATFNFGESDETFVLNNKDTSASLTLDNKAFKGTIVTSLGKKNPEFKDVTVTTGKLSFGQVGSVVNTNEYTNVQAKKAHGVNAAIRVTDLVEGLKIQLEGKGHTAAAPEVAKVPDDKSKPYDSSEKKKAKKTDKGAEVGIAVAYETAIADGVTAHVSAQHRFVNIAGTDEVRTHQAKAHYAGVGVTTEVAGATIKVGAASHGAFVDYGVSAEYTVAGLTAKISGGQYIKSVDAEKGSDAGKAVGTHAVSLGYKFDQDGIFAEVVASHSSKDKAGKDMIDGKIATDVAYTMGAVKYFAGNDITFAEKKDVDVDTEFGVTYTNAASYTAKLVGNNAFEENSIVVTAKYEF